ncbi:dUTP diphosphatase [bacterium]|nr:dUTP diphosphatase [bacterium]
MKVKIKRVDTTLPLPQYETHGSVGFDLVCRETCTVNGRSLALIPSNIIVETPPGYMLLLTLRSSTPRKKGLLKPHGVGVVDQDYCGPEDEIKIQVFNFREEAVTVERGEKIGQGIFVRINQVEWDETESMEKSSRGGFGSTDQS